MKGTIDYKTKDQPINQIMEEKLSHKSNLITWEEARKKSSI